MDWRTAQFTEEAFHAVLASASPFVCQAPDIPVVSWLSLAAMHPFHTSVYCHLAFSFVWKTLQTVLGFSASPRSSAD